jgi:hypothetical protein
MIKSEESEMVRACSMNEKKNACRILVKRLKGKRILEKPRRRCEDNIKMALGDRGFRGMEWIDLAQDRGSEDFFNTVMNLRGPQNVGKPLSGCTIGRFSRRVQIHAVSRCKITESEIFEIREISRTG